MTDEIMVLSRRAVIGATVGVAAGTTVGVATAQETGTPTGEETPTGNGTDGDGGGGPPDFGGFLDPVGNFDGTVVDARGEEMTTVAVGAQGNGGAYAFDPPAVHVDNGATVVWEWTGEGGGHNVVSDGDGPLDSGDAVASEGTTYEYTFDSDGIYNYICEPHESLGMKAAVVVGTDYPTAGGGGGSGGGGLPPVPDSVKTLGVASTVVLIATLGLTYVFMRYGGDYELPDTK